MMSISTARKTDSLRTKDTLRRYKKYSKRDQRSLATCAADCAERVLPYFEKVCTKDDRPRKAIEACRTWIRTGVFKMADVRGASLAAHAAAREAREDYTACFAARAAGHAVATAHVPQHAFGAAYYALKAVAEADPANAEANAAKERNWESRRLPRSLRQEFLNRVIVQKDDHKISIKIRKGKDF